MKKKILIEEIIWTLCIVGVVAAIIMYYPSKDYWGERIWDKIVNPGKPLEGNLITIGNPPIFSIKVPNFEEWELADIEEDQVIIRREDEKSPVRIEITATAEDSVPHPRTFREFKAYMLSHQSMYTDQGFTVRKNKNIYIDGDRWALLEMQGDSDDTITMVYMHRSPKRFYEIKVDFPIGEGFNPRESNQYARAVAYSLKILEE